MAKRGAAWVTFAAGAVLAAWLAGPRSVNVSGQPPRADAKRFELQGVASCAASNCHNGNGARGDKGSEYSTWLIHDPHARAYDVLLTERSILIERNLRGPNGDARAETDGLCLHCHVQPGVLTAARRQRYSLTDGVGCESCHGAAQKWLGPHTTWVNLDPAAKRQEYARHGMVWMHDLTARVQVCATCHVGSAEADVDHDLIAAGHPRLNFEFAVYQSHMPRHWNTRAERVRYPDFEARAWAVGQVVCAQAALQLLDARAQSADKPWPEFAEYNCYACHQEIRPGVPAPGSGRTAVPGMTPWSDWHYAVLKDALALQPKRASGPFLNSLGELRQLMGRPLPDRTQVARQAQLSSDLLKGWLEEAENSKLTAPGLLQGSRDALQNMGQGGRLDWDVDMQRTLGMTALYQAQRELGHEQATREFQTFLRQQTTRLQFPPGFDGPREPKAE